MLLYLLRHGETAWNVERRIQGASDTPLNGVGLRQAEALADLLRERPIAALYTSPLRRARQTAEAVAGALGLPVREEPRLAELDQGELEGMAFADIHLSHNGFFEGWQTRPGEVRMPGGESLPELQARAWAALEDIRRTHAGQSVAAVSHNLAIITVLCRILDVELNAFRRIRQHNAALNIIEHTPERGWTVVTMNSLAHLNGVPASENNPYL